MDSEHKIVKVEGDHPGDEKFVEGLGFGSLGWGKSKKIVMGDGETARHYEAYLPGYHNLDDLKALPINAGSKVMEEDEDSLFDLYRLQMQSESYQSLKFQVDTLITYGVQDLKRACPERIRMAIERAKADFEQDDGSTMTSLIDQYLLVNGRHYINAASLKDKEGKTYHIARATILELVENAEKDILKEVESRGPDLEYGSFEDEEELSSIDLLKLRSTLGVLIQKKVDHIWKMEERTHKFCLKRPEFNVDIPAPIHEVEKGGNEQRCAEKKNHQNRDALDLKLSQERNAAIQDYDKFKFVDTGCSLIVPKISSIALPPSMYQQTSEEELVIYCRLRSGKLIPSHKEAYIIMQAILKSARELKIDFRTCSEENAKRVWEVSVKFRERTGGRWISLRDELQRIFAKRRNVRVDESDESDDAMDLLSYYMETLNI